MSQTTIPLIIALTPLDHVKPSSWILTAGQSVNHLSKLFAEHGPDTWWTQSMDSLVSDDLKNRDLEMKREIFDIWMDSGVSWSTVLRHPQIADVYLEGTDQFSGWFQSSALLSYALRGKLPFKNLFVHSFVVDERGDKMSKSLGNVVSPKEVTHGGENFPVYGVDSLRWFVAYHSVNKSLIHFGPKIMQASAENVSKIRGVLKYLLGNLSDFNPSTDLVPLDRQLPVDQFQLYLLASFIKEARKHYDGYSFNQVCHSMLNYISNQLSSFYFLATKDRLYCDRADSLKRKSCQSTLYHCLQNLTSILSPILPHLAQEVYNHYPNCFKLSNGTSALHTWKLGRDTDWASSNSKGMEIALEYLEKVKVKQSEMKLKNFSVSIRCSQQAYDDLMCMNHTDYSAEECLNDILGSTNVTISVDPALLTPIISVEENKVQCCSRCWRFTITNGYLCLRCLDVVSNLVIK